MSGHNKWSKIKHKKASTDAVKSRIFSQLSKLITLETKLAGGDKNSATVKAVIEKAKKENMPKDNIEKALQRGIEKGTEDVEKVIYEAYGPGGSALLILALTDNRNRTAAEIRHNLSKQNISLANPGSASWLFEQKNGEHIPKETISLNEENKELLCKIIEKLNNVEDVNKITTNTDIV